MTDERELIGSDFLLDAPQRRTLDVVTDMIVPVSADGRKPSGRDVGVLDHIRAQDSATVLAVARELEGLDAASRERHGVAFADLDAAARREMVDALRAEDPAFLRTVAMQTMTCYYQDDRVLEAIGLGARPPFPEGYEVPTGDLALLEPVRQRGSIVREA